MTNLRRAAVAGSWYPASAPALQAAVDGYLERAALPDVGGDLVALIVPHAGLMYSGPVAAHAYRLLSTRSFDTAIIVGPSHFVGFDGIALYPSGGFDTPLGVAAVDDGIASRLLRASPVVRASESPHMREHSLEMQLPFVRRLAPSMRIVPMLMGHQTRETAAALAAALADVLAGESVLLIASTDLSHYHDAVAAHRLDSVVVDAVTRLDADGLQDALVREPDHACGGGPMVAVMKAAQALGASSASILCYADSGDVSGDKTAVVGYLAAALTRPAAR
jgi:hypothetical protein